MKNKIITAIALCSLFITGCSLDKAYLNGPNASTFPATKSEVEAGVFATYKGLTLIDASSTPFPGIQDNASDIGASRLNAANYNYQQQSKLPPSNAWVTKVYTQIYKTAARANLVLDGIDNVRELMSEQEYNMYKAELLLVRSFLYDWGCQLYGDIPYIDHTLKLGDTYTRTPKEEVISRILNEDLADEMLDFLPIRHNKNSYGSARLGRAGAYGLKARICLNWKYYEEAAYYADKALKLAEEGGYSLQAYDIRYCGEDHTKGEPTPSNLFGINGHKNSDEWIWALQYNTAISSNQHNAGYYAAPRIAGGCSYFSPTQAFLDAIQCTDGKSIVESPLFDYQNPWKNRDPRLDLFCVRPGSRVLGMQFETNPSAQTIKNYNDKEEGVDVANSEAYGSKSEYGANGSKGPCGYLWRKYLDIQEYKYNNAFGTSSVCVLSYPLMRLAELYLIRAEANIEWNGGDLSVAKADIETIRSRAHMPGLSENLSRDGLRSALRYERMVELCNEGFRWFDIRRWDMAESVISGTLYAPALDGSVSNAVPTIDSDWHVTYNGQTFDGKDMNLRRFITMSYDPMKDALWPIPEDERIANPLITQNPGYAGHSIEE